MTECGCGHKHSGVWQSVGVATSTVEYDKSVGVAKSTVLGLYNVSNRSDIDHHSKTA